MPSRTRVRWGNTAGLIGDTYRDMAEMSGIVMVTLFTLSLLSLVEVNQAILAW